MDIPAMRTANLLVGNSMGDAVLEMTLLGIEAEFDCDAVIAVTGADMSPTVNGVPCHSYRSVEVKKGDVLKFSVAKNGLRTYLAVCGGFDIPHVMDSSSTNLKCKIGGFEGRKLEAGDEIPLRLSSDIYLFGPRRCPAPMIKDKITLRALLGPQDYMFTDKGIATFFGSEYTVTEQADRMGIRLSGEAIESKNGVDIISDGIVTGSVQIPSSGTPIVLTSDRQTTGGYAKIATVITPDLWLLAQARQGTKVRFSPVSLSRAHREAVRREGYFTRMERNFIMGMPFSEKLKSL